MLWTCLLVHAITTSFNLSIHNHSSPQFIHTITFNFIIDRQRGYTVALFLPLYFLLFLVVIRIFRASTHVMCCGIYQYTGLPLSPRKIPPATGQGVPRLWGSHSPLYILRFFYYSLKAMGQRRGYRTQMARLYVWLPASTRCRRARHAA